MEEYSIEVTDMSCKSCECTVREKVTGLREASSVYPDARADEVTVVGELGTSERVRQAIIELGYEAEVPGGSRSPGRRRTRNSPSRTGSNSLFSRGSLSILQSRLTVPSR